MKTIILLLSITLVGCKYYTKEYQLEKLNNLENPIIVTDKWQYSVMEMYVKVKDSKGKTFIASYKLGEELYNTYLIGDTINPNK